MQMKICANCSRPMDAVRFGDASFEQCPQCGGAWLDEPAFDALLEAQRRFGGPSGHDHELGAVPHQVKRLIKMAAAAALVLVVLIGLAGYFVIWPVISRGVGDGTLAKAGKDLVGKEMKALGVPADVGTWARDTAKKKVDQTLREAAGLPQKDAQGESKQGAPEATEADK